MSYMYMFNKNDFGGMGLHIKMKSLADGIILRTYPIDEAKEMSGRLQNASEISTKQNS